MKAAILYKPNTESESSVQEYVRGFEHQTGRKIELIDAESVEGVQKAITYDVLQYPAIVALREDGSFIEAWVERDKWPTVSELSLYS